MKFLKILIVPMLVVALAGCATKQQGGTLLGAGLGGLLGSQFGSGRGKLVGVAIGVLAGAMIGGEIGKSLDRADQLVAQSNTQYALERIPNGHRGPVWQNPDRRTSGYTVPTKTYQIRSGQYCREYQQIVIVGGQEQKAYGKACRQIDGSWKIVNR